MSCILDDTDVRCWLAPSTTLSTTELRANMTDHRSPRFIQCPVADSVDDREAASRIVDLVHAEFSGANEFFSGHRFKKACLTKGFVRHAATILEVGQRGSD